MRADRNELKLTKEEKSKAVEFIKNYLEENFELKTGNLASEIFLDEITKTIGGMYYNKGVMDSMSLMTEKLDDLYLLIKEE